MTRSKVRTYVWRMLLLAAVTASFVVASPTFADGVQTGSGGG